MADSAKHQEEEDHELGLAEVLREELEYLHVYRKSAGRADADAARAPAAGASLQDCQRALHTAGTAALCLSGGGIRSATFCLGVIQGLAKRGLLRSFDYISTVSGGGYIGGWLSSWLFRSGSLPEVEKALRTYPPPRLEPGTETQIPQLQWLRNYSNYLAPKTGLLSVDTWTLLVTYVRNLLVVWMALVPPLMLALYLPRLAWDALSPDAAYGEATVRWFTAAFAVLSVVLLAFGERNSYVYEYARKGRDTPLTYLYRVNIPYTLGAFLLGLAWLVSPKEAPWVSIVPTAVLVMIAGATVIGIASEWQRPPKATPLDLLRANRYDIFACLVQALVMLFAFLAFFRLTARADPAAWQFVLYPVGALVTMGVGDLFYAAFLSRRASDEDRERWARSAAWFAILSLAWLAWSGLALLAPLVLRFPGWESLAYLLDGGLAGLLGIVLARIGLSPHGRGAKSGENGVWQNYGVPALMVLFVLLVLSLLSSLNVQLEEALGDQDAFGVHGRTLGLGVAVLLSALCLLVLYGININQFSLHAMYRDRLVRAYLGATRTPGGDGAGRFSALPEAFGRFKHDSDYEGRWRQQGEPRAANPHTGFDDADNPDLFWLGLRRTQPLWLVNMALNVTDSREHLSWQERKAASFTASPLHCGGWLTGYRETLCYGGKEGGIRAGTAVAISGAAANPNMGYHSSPALTFLMTFFNARLGWWLGNPSAQAQGNRRGKNVYREPSPSNGLFQLLKELLGMTDDRSDWVHLSDGGHFENLGLYEMCVRRCRFILVCDASADPKRGFEDLGNAIRKIRIDLGAQITPLREDTRRIGPRDTAKGAGFTLFRIEYPGDLEGTLLYLKPSFYADDAGVPRDVAQYAAASEDFPHESTGDQFFSESQFESYRALGYYQLVRSAFAGLAEGASLAEAFKAAERNVAAR